MSKVLSVECSTRDGTTLEFEWCTNRVEIQVSDAVYLTESTAADIVDYLIAMYDLNVSGKRNQDE